MGSKQEARDILLTCALPYANGPIHLGHLLEHIQADIWSRYQKLQNHNVYFICADDTHGTAIMLKAESLGITPEKLIHNIHADHTQDLAKFNIDFNYYGSTNSETNKKLSQSVFIELDKKGYIAKRDIEQFYDPEKEMFLADRFIKGECPKCHAKDQYGDNCEVCAATYSPVDLINPYSVVTGATPIQQVSEHLFFDLPKLDLFLKDWVKSGTLQEEVLNKMNEWLTSGLKQWDISRDAPYFGFVIPGYTDKYFYVWVDAPVAYYSSFLEYGKSKGLDFSDKLKSDSSLEVNHFIGKDIVYFHSLFWPAMLYGSNLKTPSHIWAHGYITINGAKMSKSKGTFIQAKTFSKMLDTDLLRYYYASKLTSKIEDIDLNLEDFVNKVNSDLVNKIINLAARNVKFITERFNNTLSSSLADQDLFNRFISYKDEINSLYESREYSKVVRIIAFLADEANKYIDAKAPWVLAKNEDTLKDLHLVASMGIELFKVIFTYLKPIVPNLTVKAENFLNLKLSFDNLENKMLSHKINNFVPMMKRLTAKDIEDLISQAKLDNAN
ncbi:MAG: methionine--tRNA ligase [Psittacicella sp.]